MTGIKSPIDSMCIALIIQLSQQLETGLEEPGWIFAMLCARTERLIVCRSETISDHIVRIAVSAAWQKPCSDT